MARRLTRFLRRNTIALLALFIALSGTTYAASNALPKNSVGTKQLKKNAVTTPKMKNNAVTGAKVKDNSITGADILESSLGKVPSATTADNATAAANATNLGGHAASFYAPGVLQSGQTESGTYAVASAGGAGYMVQGFAFPTPLAAALDSSHVAYLAPTVTTTNCPGVGQAAAGYLCVYAQSAVGATPNNGHAVNSHVGLGGADTYGFMLFFNAAAGSDFSYGSWTVKAA